MQLTVPSAFAGRRQNVIFLIIRTEQKCYLGIQGISFTFNQE